MKYVMYNFYTMTNKTYIITGPTASGKSGFAHELALRTNGCIINCDSVQIYRGIENISASPFAERLSDIEKQEIDGVPYKLFSILPLDEQISVAQYLELARNEYNNVLANGFTPIFVGGTGYYVNALVGGISPMPDISNDARMRARSLVANDIENAKKLLPPEFTATDPQRVSRALEVFFETGHHITEYQNAPRVGAVIPNAVKILINPPLDELRTRISNRIPEMIRGGAHDEARQIIQNNWNPSRAIGAVQLVDFLRGKISEQECISNWVNKTNQYAKRQRTWFRGQFIADIEIKHIPSKSDVLTVL
ncbi:MAG: tRNA (adenosine(37)-N6)-dimethylallyltransferase MiaA [Alphaproteobacteria bacterium]